MSIQEAYNLLFETSFVKITRTNIRKVLDKQKIKKQYRELTKKYHPDLHKSSSFYNALFADINVAVEILNGYLADENYVNINYNRKLSVEIYRQHMLDKLEKVNYIFNYKIAQEFFNYTDMLWNDIEKGLSTSEIKKRIIKYFAYDDEMSKIMNNQSRDFLELKEKICKFDIRECSKIEGCINKFIMEYNIYNTDVNNSDMFRKIELWVKNKYSSEQKKTIQTRTMIDNKVRDILTQQIKKCDRAHDYFMHGVYQQLFSRAKEMLAILDGDFSDQEKLIVVDNSYKMVLEISGGFVSHFNHYQRLKNKLISFYKIDSISGNYLSEIENIDEQIRLLSTDTFYGDLDDDEKYLQLTKNNSDFNKAIREYDGDLAIIDMKKRNLHDKLIQQIVYDGGILLDILNDKTSNEARELYADLNSKLKMIRKLSNEELFIFHNEVILGNLGKYMSAKELDMLRKNRKFTYIDSFESEKRQKKIDSDIINDYLNKAKKIFTFFICYYGIMKKDVPMEIVSIFDQIVGVNLTINDLEMLSECYNKMIDFANKINVKPTDNLIDNSGEYIKKKKAFLIKKIEETYDKTIKVFYNNNFQDLYMERNNLDLPDLYILFQRLIASNEEMISGRINVKPSRR